MRRRRGADGQSDVEGSQQYKHVTLRVGTAMARMNMVTDSVLKLCAVLEQAAACLSDLPIAAKYKSYRCTLNVQAHICDMTIRWVQGGAVTLTPSLTRSPASPLPTLATLSPRAARVSQWANGSAM